MLRNPRRLRDVEAIRIEEQIGVITCEFADDSTAIVTFSTPFPVALCRGILQGCCKRFMPNALIEQSASEADTGANVVCTFHISW